MDGLQNRIKVIFLLSCLVVCMSLSHGVNAMNLLAEDFGVVADGRTDDGPAIQNMLAHAAAQNKPSRLIFPPNRQIYIKTGNDRYVFSLDNRHNLVIEGRGSTFILATELRFLQAQGCNNLKIVNLRVDFIEQPTTPGTILKVDTQAQHIDVRLDDPAMADRLGGPTHEDGEQAFFGMALLDASYDTTKVKHFYVDRVERVSPGVVRITNNKSRWVQLNRHVKPGETRICLPVPGIAHRYGPGALFDIDGCTDVSLSRIDVWSAPWFAFRLMRNEGLVRFQHVNVQPKPDSGKVLSACRDAIHAKGNRAELLFQDCTLSGLGDDAFNLATHCSLVRQVKSPTQIMVAQAFPLQHIPFRINDTLVMLDPANNRKIAERKILAVEELPSTNGERAPSSLLTLDQPIGEDVQPGIVAWSRESANPKSTIRRCIIRRSCRLQTPVTIEDCDVESLLWFYGNAIEGPGPESVVIRNSRLKANGLTPQQSNAIIVSGWELSQPQAPTKPGDAVLKEVKLINNRILGTARVQSAYRVQARKNRFMHASDAVIEYEQCTEVREEP